MNPNSTQAKIGILFEHGVEGTLSEGLFHLDQMFWDEPPLTLDAFRRTYGLKSLALLKEINPLFQPSPFCWLLPDGRSINSIVSGVTNFDLVDLVERTTFTQHVVRVQYWLNAALFHIDALAIEYKSELEACARGPAPDWTKKYAAPDNILPWTARVPVESMIVYGGLPSFPFPGHVVPPRDRALFAFSAFLVAVKRALDSLVDVLNCLPCLSGATLPMGVSAAIKVISERPGLPSSAIESLLAAWSGWAKAVVNYRDYMQHHGELVGIFSKAHAYTFRSPSGMIGLFVGIPDGPEGGGWPGKNLPAFSLRRDALSFAHSTLTEVVPLCAKIISNSTSELTKK